MRVLTALSVLLALTAATPAAELAIGTHPDATYFGVIRSVWRIQDPAGNIGSEKYGFLSYIFAREGGTLEDVYLSTPAADKVNLPLLDHRVHSGKYRDNYFMLPKDAGYPTPQAFEAAYPNGTYEFRFNTRAGSHRETLHLGPGTYPQPSPMRLSQNGNAVDVNAINADLDLLVSWDFPQGKADPRGILDDMAFVTVRDCNNEKVLHSGRPFQGEYLTYTETEYRIPENILEPGRKYVVILDLSINQETMMHDGIVGMTSYATGLFLDVRTSGVAPPGACTE